MYPSNDRPNQPIMDTINRLRPNVAFFVMILGALIAFEIFNYSTTDHALKDLLGGLTFAGIPWSTVLAIAFCGIDFAGIARLFTPQAGDDQPKEAWYLFGAWLLAATMNAILTWWGVSMAVVDHNLQSASVVDPQTITSVVPVFVAIMVWVIRILIIGTLSVATDRLVNPGMHYRAPVGRASSRLAGAQPSSLPETINTSAYTRPVAARQAVGERQTVGERPQASQFPSQVPAQPISARPSVSQRPGQGNYRPARFAPEEEPEEEPVMRSRPEPTYHSLSRSASPNKNNGPRRM